MPSDPNGSDGVLPVSLNCPVRLGTFEEPLFSFLNLGFFISADMSLPVGYGPDDSHNSHQYNCTERYREYERNLVFIFIHWLISAWLLGW